MRRSSPGLLGFRILCQRYGFLGPRPLSLAEAARAHGITRARARLLEVEALRTVREVLAVALRDA